MSRAETVLATDAPFVVEANPASMGCWRLRCGDLVIESEYQTEGHAKADMKRYSTWREGALAVLRAQKIAAVPPAPTPPAPAPALTLPPDPVETETPPSALTEEQLALYIDGNGNALRVKLGTVPLPDGSIPEDAIVERIAPLEPADLGHVLDRTGDA